MIGPECGLCKTAQLRPKEKYSVTVNITTTDAAAKVKESAKSKAEYRQIYFNFVKMDVTATEFELHKEPKNTAEACTTSNRYYRR